MGLSICQESVSEDDRSFLPGNHLLSVHDSHGLKGERVGRDFKGAFLGKSLTEENRLMNSDVQSLRQGDLTIFVGGEEDFSDVDSGSNRSADLSLLVDDGAGSALESILDQSEGSDSQNCSAPKLVSFEIDDVDSF